MRFNYKTIFWDFDGVLMESNTIRDIGFRKVLQNYPSEQVEQLIVFHKKNGGLSRYVKFRYFFEDIRFEKVDEEKIYQLADDFSVLMRNLLIDNSLLIDETIAFVKDNYDKYDMYIVSGSDERELRFLCEKLFIDKYFKGIYGSPTPKTALIEKVLRENTAYLREECVLVGDSINDYEAAKQNSIHFEAYNSDELNKFNTNKESIF
ncbi:HAD-superfamily hydrolase, subfamily IA, variant 1 [Chloroherpeton thalassium ATCC 35110]|uniref:phosphoglycolate phosphatase n=1 Tax=Chloroherpeton thalassium (strain ATCC 35110 / GB-78) TaxID=517418 RepID=B3QVJ1_CHLT3|nr:HAD-IA family hydrolase [Chloroherpeton thalassium]ACF14591.1 HAD-superfamily hydrolase, subfamily IA, variant 1 [Chloroherpeton thalassium ATCC 35110]